MKHLFCVHSSITYYISKAIIEYYNIALGDVVMCVDNHYVNMYDDMDCKKEDMTGILAMFKAYDLSKFLSLPYNIKRFDTILGNIMQNDTYFAYIPNVTATINQVIITNKKCVGYNFIEEGIGSFKKELFYRCPIPFHGMRHLVLKTISYFCKRIEFEHPFLAKYRKSNFKPAYYYFKSFIEAIPSNSIYLPYPKFNQIPIVHSGSHIFIVSPLLEYKLALSDTFTKSIIFLAEIIKRVSNSIIIKFHPYQKAPIKESIIKIFDDYSIQLTVLDDSIPIEPIILSDSKLNIYGFESSVLYYASQLECNNVYSIDRYLSSIDDRYKNYKDTIDYELIFKNVKQL